jgi:type I restriction enzyme S subunit
MSNTSTTVVQATKRIIPELRFPEFQNNGEWEEKTIGDIVISESSSMALNKLNLKSSGYPVYGADSIVGYIDDYQQKEKYISIVKDGSGVGRLNLCKSQSSILGTLACLKSKDENKYNLVWIYYLLNTIDFSSYVKGAGIPHIYYSDFKHKNVAVPLVSEQQKIASCLSSLDEVIAAHIQNLEALKDHKKGLMQNLFPQEGETVPKYRFPEFENDGEWVEKKLGDACEMQAGKFVSASEIKKELVNGLFPCYGGNGLRGYTKSYTHSGKFSLIGRQGALCGNITLADGEFHATEHAVVVTPVDNTDTVWLYYLLILLNLNQYATGQAQPGLSVSNLEKLKIVIPENTKEQQKIADCLSSLDALITGQVVKIEQLKLHKKGLMQGLFPVLVN